MAAAANLEDVPSMDLMNELIRRMKCSSKPDKRLILVGPYASSGPHHLASLLPLLLLGSPYIRHASRSGAEAGDPTRSFFGVPCSRLGHFEFSAPLFSSLSKV
ncbi:hypothetical protein E2562_025470 [Oryza meyeriana var. granulata]|uniref:Uncharacterized protein n=1 Tax=Oryza meyeriana var. granulata TaxID=110450 RepID=A0A6G1C8X8_9ORYZ|nr:hypothetical protein E2562_025470 [Oryza meyeriana var. granulata]